MEPGQMPPEGGAPQEGGPSGGDVMKEMSALMLEDAQKYQQMASALPPELGEQVGMIAQAIAKTVEGFGIEMGGPSGEIANPDTAGTSAQPVDPRTA